MYQGASHGLLASTSPLLRIPPDTQRLDAQIKGLAVQRSLAIGNLGTGRLDDVAT